MQQSTNYIKINLARDFRYFLYEKNKKMKKNHFKRVSKILNWTNTAKITMMIVLHSLVAKFGV
jgi:hypothetical protein